MRKPEKSHLGYIVPLTVGHKDRPNEAETHIIKHLLRKSGFLRAISPDDISIDLKTEDDGPQNQIQVNE